MLRREASSAWSRASREDVASSDSWALRSGFLEGLLGAVAGVGDAKRSEEGEAEREVGEEDRCRASRLGGDGGAIAEH